MDDAVLAAYDWADLDLSHGFHKVGYLPESDRLRFTISESARLEVLRRLTALNRQRYDKEVARGQHGTKIKGSSTRAQSNECNGEAISPQPSFDFDANPANEGNYRKAAEPRAQYQARPAYAVVEYLKAHPGWHAKAEILAATDIPEEQWNSTINELIAAGNVKRQGEKRGARYRAVIEGAKE